MTEALVQVDNLSRYYQGICAVNQVSFSLYPGEVLGFLGPNGAGKSTTMRVISGNLAPTKGQISIAGYDIIKTPREAKRHLGYLPEHPPVYRDATVDEFLIYCARLRGPARQHVSGTIDRVKQQCGLEGVGARLIGNMSKGYQQRVGIAQAIIHNPSVVIFDEPTVGLDPIQILEIRNLIRDLGREHSVILSTHILSEVQATCDRVQIIRTGELVYNAPIEALERPAEKWVQIKLRTPPHIHELEQISGIDQVESLSEGCFHLSLISGSNTDALVNAAVEQDWGLEELVPKQQSLENLFLELTRNSDESNP